jgi:hypothetical protein
MSRLSDSIADRVARKYATEPSSEDEIRDDEDAAIPFSKDAIRAAHAGDHKGFLEAIRNIVRGKKTVADFADDPDPYSEE